MAAAGCFGYGVEMQRAGLADVTRLGALVTNPVTLRPQRGTRQRAVVELADGLSS